jgi:hypothetical protein
MINNNNNNNIEVSEELMFVILTVLLCIIKLMDGLCLYPYFRDCFKNIY